MADRKISQFEALTSGQANGNMVVPVSNPASPGAAGNRAMTLGELRKWTGGSAAGAEAVAEAGEYARQAEESAARVDLGALDSAVEQSGQNAASAATSQIAAAGSAAQAQAAVDTATGLIITTFGNFDTLAQLVADHPTASVGNTAFVRETGEAGTVHRWSGSAWVDTGESPLAGAAKKADGFKVITGANGHPQIVDANSVELLGFDATGAAILRISPRSLPDLLALLAAFLPGSDASLFPSLRGAGGIELLGFDRGGHARFAVSQDVADQVGQLLNLDLIYDPVAAGFIASPDIIVFGDSMSGSSEQTSALSAALGGRTVNTLAKGGQSAHGIAVCAGAMPLTITVTGGSIPADGSPVAVSSKNVNILSSGGTNAGTARVYFASAGLASSCLIETDSAGNWTIKREAAGAAIAVAAGATAILHPTSGTSTIPATSLYRARTAIIRLGRNGLRNTRAARVANTLHPIRQLIRFLTPRVKNIVIVGPYNGRAKRASDGSDFEPSGSAAYVELMTLIEEMQREFGRLFLDMRTAAVRNAPYDIGITLTADDQADMALDCIARQLFSDDIHMGAPMRSWEGSFLGNHLAALGF